MEPGSNADKVEEAVEEDEVNEGDGEDEADKVCEFDEIVEAGNVMNDGNSWAGKATSKRKAPIKAHNTATKEKKKKQVNCKKGARKDAVC